MVAIFPIATVFMIEVLAVHCLLQATGQHHGWLCIFRGINLEFVSLVNEGSFSVKSWETKILLVACPDLPYTMEWMETPLQD